MGKKGPTRHLKRHASPSFWPIKRKHGTWSTRTNPGPHKFNTSIPLAIVVRDSLKYAKTAKEAKRIIKEGNILVDGKPRLDEKYPVGLMDVVSLPDAQKSYRVVPDKRNKIILHQISDEEAFFKLYKLISKTSQKKGRTQLNLHDGSNLEILSETDNYKINDVIKIKIPEKEVLANITFEQMKPVIITGGRSQGEQGILLGVGPEPGWKKTATIRTPQGEDIKTLAQYILVIGDKEPIISLPGVES